MSKVIQETDISQLLKDFLSNTNKNIDHLKLTSSNGITKISIQISEIVNGLTRYEIDYKKLCTRLGLNPVWIGRVVEWNGVGIKLTGIDIKKKTRSVLFMNIITGDKVYLTPDTTRKLLG